MQGPRPHSTATPPPQRDAALLNLAKDPLSNIRLLALELVERRINANQPVADELRLQVGAMLADVDPRVRQKSALLIANLGGKDVSEQLLSRLNDEKVQSVRQGLLTALGQLRESKALEVVLEEIGSNYDDVCAAAAIALARIASKQPLTEPQHDQAAKVLVDRYHQKSDSGDGVAIREALLTAMGVVTHEDVAKVLVEALDEEAATVRLAAVNSLAQLGKTEFATALEPLTTDPDRGVRQAAITALGKLDGAGHLQTILKRTHASVEADGTVRKQAWDVVMAVLAKADSDLLWSLSDSLAKRPDAAEQVVKVNRMLVAALKKSKDKKLPAAQRQLARSLMKIPLAAEAALNLAEAYTALQQAKSPQALQVWLEWIEAMLAGDDITVIKVISRNKDALTFAQGCDRLEARLKEMLDEGKYDQVALIAADAVKQLAERLDTDGGGSSEVGRIPVDVVLVDPKKSVTDTNAASAHFTHRKVCAKQ